MKFLNFYFFLNFYLFFVSLDLQIYLDIFAMSKVLISCLDSFYVATQLIFEYLVLNSYFTITTLVIFYILFLLIYNMFHYSIWYFFVNFFFCHNWVIFPSKWTIRLYRMFRWKGFEKKFLLPYFQADNMALICSLLAVVLVYHFFLYKNLLNLELVLDSTNFYINLNLLKWISLPFEFINFGILIDHLSLLMLVVVLSISTLVHYYSIDYMATDPWLLTFLKYLSGFTLAMLVLVLANNYALLFMGWEGVGIFSYLLIGFWYTRTLALKASLKAVIVNRIGDVALIIASALIIHFFGTLEFKKLQILLLYMFTFKIDSWVVSFQFFEISLVTLISFFLLIAGVGKSAQFGLHTWLPDAMEGPTPVSALIHAATMVTAGVYLIVRNSFFFEFSDVIRNLTLFVGAFTALFGSITACFQYDIKRIIAFSTCSQLGYMFLACGLSAYNLAMFHLFIHAFFKALLFLCAGSVIHAIGDEQDIWRMGGLFYYLPLTYVGLCVGFFSLAGLPFTSGFFSKDTIIELALTKRTLPALYGYTCASLAAWFTALYSIRFFYYVIFWQTILSRTILSTISEHGNNMLLVITILTFITIFIGGFTKNLLTTPFSFIFFSDSIFVANYNFYFNFYEIFLDFYQIVHDYYHNYFKYILLLLPLSAAYLGILFYDAYLYCGTYNIFWEDMHGGFIDERKTYTKTSLGEEFFTDLRLWKFFETKSSADQVYNTFLVKPILDFSYKVSYKELDRGWLEFFLVKCPTAVCFFLAKNLNQNFGSLKLNFLPGLIFLTMTLIMLSILIYANL